MNQASTRGNALGFHLDFIANIKSLRGNEPGSDLLVFLVEIITKEFPDYLDILRELAVIRESKEIKFSELEEALDMARAIVRDVERSIQLYPTTEPRPDDDKTLELSDEDLFLQTAKILRLIIDAYWQLRLFRICH